MVLHGKTKIELTDVKTGKVETIEKNNFITVGAETFLKPIGALWNNYDLYNNSYQKETAFYETMAEFLYGSCLLFDSAIDGDENKIFPGTENGYTGGAEYRVVNTTSDAHFGSYNSSESIIDLYNRTITFVYDFATNQCNGNIGAVCLAPQGNAKGASFGVDSAFTDPNKEGSYVLCATINDSISGNENMRGRQYTTLYDYTTNVLNPIALNMGENYGWYFNATSNSVEKIGIPITKQSLFVKNYLWQGTVIDSNGITFPEGITPVLCGSCGMYDDENCWVYGYDDTNIYMFVIELATGAIKKTVTIENPCTGSKGTPQYLVDTGGCVFYADGYCLISADESTTEKSVVNCYRINENNPTDIEIAEITGDRTGAYVSGMLCPRFVLNGRVYLYDAIKSTASLYSVWNIGTNKINNRKSAYVYGSSSWHGKYCYIRDIKNPLLLICRANPGHPDYVGNTPFMMRSFTFLSTINNLDEVVTKTSDKTMKITYTLTEVAE